MQGNWAFISQLMFLQLKALNKIIQFIHKITKTSDKGNDGFYSHTLSKYYRYDNQNEAEIKIRKHWPISVTHHQSGFFSCTSVLLVYL
jgi:hypothetical protein